MQWRRRQDIADDRKASQGSIFAYSPDQKQPIANGHQYTGSVYKRPDPERMGILNYIRHVAVYARLGLSNLAGIPLSISPGTSVSYSARYKGDDRQRLTVRAV